MKKLIDSIGIDNLISIIGFCVTIIVVFLTSFLTSKSNQKRMVSETFKNEGIKVQERLLEFWSNLLCGTLDDGYLCYTNKSEAYGKLKKEDIVNMVQKEGIMYSSKSTIKAIATYQQYTYKSLKNAEEKKSKKGNVFKTMETLIVPLRVLKRMKYDFTGEKVSEVDLLRIRLNDWNVFKWVISYYYIIYYYIKERIVFFILIITIIFLFKYVL